MERVQAEVANHYQSSIVEKVRARDGILTIGKTTIRLAKQFGFCYGVERAIIWPTPRGGFFPTIAFS